jgi:Arc/MetJ-type ribon-helix-helix transcriptional regulator
VNNSKLEFLGIRIPKKLNEEIKAAIIRGEYVTKSDLVRTALRQLLDREEVI